jgi:hypothetical protein
MQVPDRPVNFVPAKAGEIIVLGSVKLRVMEDGSNTGKLVLVTATTGSYSCP